MPNRLLTLAILGALLATGCRQFRQPAMERPSKPLPAAQVTRAVATMHTVGDARPVGRIALDREDLVVAPEQLRNLPPESNLVLTVRPHRGTNAADVGPITDLRGTSDTGILAKVSVDSAGNGTLSNETTVVYFLYDKLIGHNLVLSDESGELVAVGILGIAAEE